MSDEFRAEFNPPRRCEDTEKAWKLTASGTKPLHLPKSHTYALHRDPSNESLVVAATVSLWLAEKEGFVANDDHQEKSFVVESRKDEMSREDWFTLGAWMAVLFRGEELPVFEARKLARKLLEEQ